MPGQAEHNHIPRNNAEKSHTGHRSRVRQKFLLNGFAGMLKYEVLEAVLMMVLPRKDVKPLAKRLLDEYKTISAVISLPQDELEKIPGLGTNSAASLRMFFECMRYCLAEQCCDRVLLPTSEELRNFVRMKLGVRHHECYMAVFLNSRNYLISYHVVAEGTVDNVLNYSRNVVEMALRKGACKMLLVHNHPSGVCAPSNDDIAATGECYWTLAAMGIELIDHLIVTPTECFSFQDNGLDLNCSFKGQNNER
ncbi:MAG: DNA repair protein RadC [Lentisphaeria bacterium]|nr:DNA repair protein RadC [Lentisphaeria bacterium]